MVKRTKPNARNWTAHCLKCGVFIENAYKRRQKFCCAKHANAFNERRRKLEKALKAKGVKVDRDQGI